MELLFVFGFIGLGMAFALPILDDDDDGPAEPEPDEPVATGRSYDLISGDRILADAGDDIFTLATSDAPVEDLSIQAGDGDDDILLAPVGDVLGDPSYSNAVFNSEISGDAGDDDISLFADSSTVSGGDGDDTITFNGAGNTVTGGDGDDRITGNSALGEAVIDGGDGDDMIDAENVTLGEIGGGDGDDTILLSSHASVGQAVGVDGGPGDDIIHLDVRTPTDPWHFRFPLTGGEGADIFELEIGEGAPDAELNVDPTDYEDADTLRIEAQTIADFTPGTDQLVIDPRTDNDDYSLLTISLSDNGSDSEITLSYGNGALTRNVIIRLPGATGVSWDDVEIVGDARALTVPA